jgi:hypothetical protein
MRQPGPYLENFSILLARRTPGAQRGGLKISTVKAPGFGDRRKAC